MSGAGMSVIGWVVIGGLAGWLASVMMGEKQGCFTDIIIGVLGALLGGFLFATVGQRPLTGFSVWSFFVAFIGSVVLMAFFRAIRGPQV